MEHPISLLSSDTSDAASLTEASVSAADAASAAAGAPPSNTAPVNSINRYSHILRVGIDSLYVSFQGKLLPEWDSRLKSLKLSAKSEQETERLQAQIDIGGHRFEVLSHGRGRAAYLLVDNWFAISLATATVTSIPVAYVKISNEALVLEGLGKVIESITVVVNSVAAKVIGPRISRIDLCADFLTAVNLRQFEFEHWVTRAKEFALRFANRRFSGWSIGLGGVVSGRLYNKTLELQKSKKIYMEAVWKACGHDGIQDVWRLEFQINREALVEIQVDTVDDVRGRLNPIWLYCTKSWLRLAIPNLSDDTPSRWPTHPLWIELSAAWSSDSPSIAAFRARKERIPSEERMFIHGIGAITSFMALNKITDLGEGLGEFVAEAEDFHRSKGKSLGKYVRAKVLAKGLKFNTIRTHIDTAEEREQMNVGAERYRTAKDGE